MVGAADLIGLPALFIRFLDGDLLDPCQSAVLIFYVSNYKDANSIRVLTKDCIRAASDDHAALSAVRDLSDIFKRHPRDIALRGFLKCADAA